MNKLIHDVSFATGTARCGAYPARGKRIYFARRFEDINCAECLADLRRPMLRIEDVYLITKVPRKCPHTETHRERIRRKLVRVCSACGSDLEARQISKEAR